MNKQPLYVTEDREHLKEIMYGELSDFYDGIRRKSARDIYTGSRNLVCMIDAELYSNPGFYQFMGK